jgi:hypothetical protein
VFGDSFFLLCLNRFKALYFFAWCCLDTGLFDLSKRFFFSSSWRVRKDLGESPSFGLSSTVAAERFTPKCTPKILGGR